MLPDYLAKAVPNPTRNRAPWYANTAPTYAGIFLWIAFYQQMAGGTLQHAGLGVCLLALLVAGLLSYALYYRVPAMLGMKTGFPLVCGGQFHLRHRRRLRHAGPVDGSAADRLVRRGHLLLRGLHPARPGDGIQTRYSDLRNRVRDVGRHHGVCGCQGRSVRVQDRTLSECHSAAHAAGGLLPDLGRNRQLSRWRRRSRIHTVHSPP